MSQRRATPKKTDAERGPLGAWAYGTRTILDVSVEDAAAAAGVAGGTLRKIEGGSEPKPGRRAVWELWQFYAKTGRDQGVPVEDPPEQWRAVALPAATASASSDAVAAAIQAQTGVLKDLVEELRLMREAQGGVNDTLSLVLGALMPADAVSRLLLKGRNETEPPPRGERVPRRDSGRSHASGVPPQS